MRLTTHDPPVPTGQPPGSPTGAKLRAAAERIAEEQAVDSKYDSYYKAKEQLYRNLADLRESGSFREEILLGISAEAREVMSHDPSSDQLQAAVARLEIVIELRGNPLGSPEE